MDRTALEQVVAGIVGPRSSASNGALVPSREPLSEAVITQLDMMLAQTAAFYPHQEESEETAEVYRNAFKTLAERYGIESLRIAMSALQLRPGQKFFPHPSEVAEELDTMATKARNEALAQNPYVPDPNCKHVSSDGMAWVLDADGERVMGRCECWKRWKGLARTTQRDSKAAAAGSQ